jgi:threonylcarbamoyladenosine tRNA methylthiotransferase MtaB
LFESEEKIGFMTGFTSNYIKVSAKYDPLLINDIKRIKLSGINADMQVEIEELEEVLAH